VAAKTSVEPSGDIAGDVQRSRSISGGRSIDSFEIAARGARPRRSDPDTKPTAASNRATAQGTHADRRRAGDATCGAGIPLAEPPSAIHFSSLPRSPALCQRSSGSFASALRITRSNAGGEVGSTAEIGAGSSFMIDEISDACDAPANALRPVAISYSTQPSAKMSVRPSASRPSSCSGDMYWNVPRMVPSWVRFASWLPMTVGSEVAPDVAVGAMALARPKSSSFTPVFVSMTLPGLRSRWHDPLPVRLVERVGDLDADAQRLRQRQRPSREALRQRLALEVLHDEVLGLALSADVVEARRCASATAARSSSPRARSAAAPRRRTRGAAAGP
jgi:hypothetical protein